eukprot:g8669.t1
MSLPAGGVGETRPRQQQRLGAAAGRATPAAAAQIAAATRKSMRGARREGAGAAGEAYPWLNGGVVGRPSLRQQQQHSVRDRDRTSPGEQWQKLDHPAHKPLRAANGRAPPARQRVRDRSLDPTGSGTAPSAAAAPAPAISLSTSYDMLSQSTLVSSATAKSQALKRTRSWRRPMGGASSGGGESGGSGSGSGSGDGVEDDDDEEEKATISFRDAALVAWLNSVLNFEQNGQLAYGETLSHGRRKPDPITTDRGQESFRGHNRVRSLSELKELQLLSLAVRKISGADDEGTNGKVNGTNSYPPPARGGGKLGAGAPARRNSSSGELFPPEVSMSAGSSSSLEENGGLDGGGLLGTPASEGGGRGHVVDSPAKLGRRGVGRRNSGSGIGRRHGSLRNMLPFPSGRKKGPSRASTAKQVKQDLALLLSGRDAQPKLPGHMDSAVDRACAGDVDAVRSLLNILRDHSVLKIARAENGQGLRRQATSCDPAPRILAPGAEAAAAAEVPLTKPTQKPVKAPHSVKTAAIPAAAAVAVAAVTAAASAGATPPPDAVPAAAGTEGGPSSSGSILLPTVPVDAAMLPAPATASAVPRSTSPGGIASKKRGGSKRSASSKTSSSSRRERKDKTVTTARASSPPSSGTKDGLTIGRPVATVTVAIAGASSDEDEVTNSGKEVTMPRAIDGAADTGAPPAGRGREASATVPRRKLLAQTSSSSTSLPPKSSRSSRQLSVTQPPSPGDDRLQPPSTPQMAEQAARITTLLPDSSETVAAVANAAVAATPASAAAAAVAVTPATVPRRRQSVAPCQPATSAAGTTSGTAPAAASTSDWDKALSWRSRVPAATPPARASSEKQIRPRTARSSVNGTKAAGDGDATLPRRRRSGPPLRGGGAIPAVKTTPPLSSAGTALTAAAATTTTRDSTRTTEDKPLFPVTSAAVAAPTGRRGERSSPARSSRVDESDTVPPKTTSAPGAATAIATSRESSRRRPSKNKPGVAAAADAAAAAAAAPKAPGGDVAVGGGGARGVGGSRSSLRLLDKSKVRTGVRSPISPGSSGETAAKSPAVVPKETDLAPSPPGSTRREDPGDPVASTAVVTTLPTVEAGGPAKPASGQGTGTVVSSRESVGVGTLASQEVPSRAQLTEAPRSGCTVKDEEEEEEVEDRSKGTEAFSAAVVDLRQPEPARLSGKPAQVEGSGVKGLAASTVTGAIAAGAAAVVALRKERVEEEAAAAKMSASSDMTPAIPCAEQKDKEGADALATRPPPTGANVRMSPAAIPTTPEAEQKKAKEEDDTPEAPTAGAKVIDSPAAMLATSGSERKGGEEDGALVEPAAAPARVPATSCVSPAAVPASQGKDQKGEENGEGTPAPKTCASPAAITAPQEEKKSGNGEPGMLVSAAVAAAATTRASSVQTPAQERENGGKETAEARVAAPEICHSPAAIPLTPKGTREDQEARKNKEVIAVGGGGDGDGSDEDPKEPAASAPPGTFVDTTPEEPNEPATDTPPGVATVAAVAAAAAVPTPVPAPVPEHQGPVSAHREGVGKEARSSRAPASSPAPAPASVLALGATSTEGELGGEVGARADGEAGDEPQKGPGDGPPAETFGSRCQEGMRLVVEFLGGVETVPRLMLVNTSWKAAVAPDQERLYKLLVRRSGVTPRRRAAFWEFMVLRSNRAPANAKGASAGNRPKSSSPDRIRASKAGDVEAALSPARRHSLAELARQGMASEWSKAIDADVARTFGRRPMSFRGEFGSGVQQDSRRRHWWPESLGGAPLGARTPKRGRSPEKAADGPGSSSSSSQGWGMVGANGTVNDGTVNPAAGDKRRAAESEEAAATGLTQPTTPPHLSSSWSPGQERHEKQQQEEEPGGQGQGQGHHGGVRYPSAAAAAEAAGKAAVGIGERGRGKGMMFPTVSTDAASVSTSVRDRSLSSASNNPTGGFSTLSPLGSPASDYSSGDEDGETNEAGVRRRRRQAPSPGTIKQLEVVKAQLTDALRALAIAFGDVGYCQGLDYVVAHLIKCLGTDAHVGFGSDPERVFKVILGLFRDYGLEHIYSENLEALQLMLGVLDHLIETRLPCLHRHFRDQDVDVAFFAVGWFQTLFLYNSRMPSDTIMWLWDNWVTERSYKVFFRAALAILKLSEPMLLQLDLESIMTYLSRFPQGGEWVLEKENLVPAALSIKITDAILREAQRKLDLVKKRGATGVGWTRPSPPRADAAAPSPTLNNPPLHLLHKPAYSDDQTAAPSSSSSHSGRDPCRHEDVHGSDAPPVQAALRGGGGGIASRLAKDDRHAAAAPNSGNSGAAVVAAERTHGRESRHSSIGSGSGSGSGNRSSTASPLPAPTRASPRSAPKALPKRGGLHPVFNTDRSDRSIRSSGDVGLVVPGPGPATVIGSSGRVPSFGVDMSALSGGSGGGSGSGSEKVAVGKAGEAGDEEGWAPTPSPLIFGSHSVDGKGDHGSGSAGARADGRDGGDGSGGGGGGHRVGRTSSLLGPRTPVSPSKGPPSFSGAATRLGGERPSHVWPLPKAAVAAAVPAESEAVREHVYDGHDDGGDDDDDDAMPPMMVPLHRVAQGDTSSTSSISADSADSAGGKGGAGSAKKSSQRKKKQNQKLGGKEEYALLFSVGNE